MDTNKVILIPGQMKKPVVLHTIFGVVVGYLLLHPLSMVIFWYEFNPGGLHYDGFIMNLFYLIRHSFTQHMFTMSASFTLIGAMAGLGSGLYYQKIRKQHKTLNGYYKLLKKGIVSIINEGENENVEFRKSLRYDFHRGSVNKNFEHLFLRAIAGFLNNNGGMMILGVDTDGEFVGLANDYFTLSRKDKKGFEQKIIELITTKIGGDLCPLLSFTFHRVADFEICSISIEPAHRPVYLKEGNRTVFYLRSGNVSKALTTQETVDYLYNQVQHLH